MTAAPLADEVRPGRARAVIARGGAIVVLVLLEIGLLDRAYSFRDIVGGVPSPAWLAVNNALQVIAYAGLIAAGAFCMLASAQDRALGGAWLAAARTHRWARWLAAQTALAAALFVALPLLQSADGSPWLGFSLWLAAGAAMAVCAMLALAPLRFWRALAVDHAGNLFIALFAGAATYGAIELARESWRGLSAATLAVSHWLLSLYEADVYMHAPSRLLGAGDFRVVIDAPCSGYEGVGLVVAMLGFYMFAFRRDLRFPIVLALLPFGAAAIWLLNTVRLALLVSIGAHVSPDLALGGFHSQAGWVLFLGVTIGFMAIAQFAPVFRAEPQRRQHAADPALNLAAALLAPFAALMGARTLAAAFGDGAHWVAAAAILIPCAALWLYRGAIRTQLGAVGVTPVLIGLAVGALWIATEPVGEDALGAWFAAQPPAAATAWFMLRIFGFALIVPIAEELLFRGYLHRALISRRFESVAPGAFTWTAFLVTSLLFGAMHGRWLAGALAGAAFAIALYRSKSVAGPIAAHIAANGLIALYAAAGDRWDLL